MMKPYWLLDAEDVGPIMWEAAAKLDKNVGRATRQRCEDLVGLYQGTTIPEGVGNSTLMGWWEDSLATNVCQMLADTMVSGLLANKLSPMFVTSRASYEDRERAKAMQKISDTFLREAGYGSWRDEEVASDGVVMGMGATHIWANRASLSVCYDRILPWEYLVHPEDARHDCPRTQLLIHPVDRYQFAAAYDEDEQVDAIMRAPQADEQSIVRLDDIGISDRIVVAEWYHLPSIPVDRDDPRAWGHDEEGRALAPDDIPHDGRRTIVLEDGACILHEPWPYSYVPVATFRPRKQRLSWRGRSIPEQLVGIQLEISKLEQRISNIINLWSQPLLYIWSQAGVNPHKLATNDVARIIQGRMPAGQALQYITPQAVPGELWQQLDRKKQDAYDVTGQSEMAATAKRPAGVEAAVAMQHLSDTESLRHTPTYRDWEQYNVSSSRYTVDRCRELHEWAKKRGEKLERVWAGQKDLERVNWDDADLDERKFIISVAPAALLPKTPTARIDHAFKLIEMQVLSPSEARTLFGEYSDFDRILTDAQAADLDADEHVRAALAGQKSRAVPSSYSDLETVKARALATYRQMYGDGADVDAAEMKSLRWLLEQTQALIDAMAPPPEAMPPEAAPAAPPMM